MKNVDSKMANIILNEIVDNSPSVTWDDIGNRNAHWPQPNHAQNQRDSSMPSRPCMRS